MYLTNKEGARRFKALRGLMNREDLQALIVMGNEKVGPGFFGSLRYFTNNRVIFNRQLLLFFPKDDPIILAISDISAQASQRRSFIEDSRVSSDLIKDAIDILQSKGLTECKIGANMEMISAIDYIRMKERLPKVQWVETQPQILDLRYSRSGEEVAILKECAYMCDASFDAAIQMIKPGVTEYEIAAEIEYQARKRGAEEHFTLIASGKFALNEKNSFVLPYAPSAASRRIEKGDCVLMEITPRYEGYWTQLVRTVTVGEFNEDLSKIYTVCVGAIQEALPFLKPGSTIAKAVAAMEAYTKGCGFVLKPPLGHVCGIDLVDERVSISNTRVLTPGVTIIVHPTIYTLDGKVSFFDGETYLITETGCEKMMATTTQLLTV